MTEQPERLDFVRGDATGLMIPAHAEALRAAGTEFLTEALRTFGSLSPGNRVTGIRKFEICPTGSTGEKLFVALDYARPEPGLPADMFVKFSRDFKDVFRDRRAGELASEIRFAALSGEKNFPIRAPKAYFADVEEASRTGILISELIPFGENGVEPALVKCMDHELENPLDYYRVVITELARLAAADQAGRLSPEIDRLFPFDAQAAAAADPIPYDAASVRERIARYAAFARECPRLMPAHLREPEFLRRFERDALAFLKHEKAVKTFLNADRKFIALSHFNANLDNAWFWRDARGQLACGLFDWQRARRMNIVYALWGGLCAADLDIWDHHLDELLRLFIEIFHAEGGARLALERLKLHLNFYVATMGMAAQLMEVPRLVLWRMPDAAEASGPRDERFRHNEPARCFLHTFTTFLNLWHRHDFGASLAEFLAETRDEGATPPSAG